MTISTETEAGTLGHDFLAKLYLKARRRDAIGPGQDLRWEAPQSQGSGGVVGPDNFPLKAGSRYVPCMPLILPPTQTLCATPLLSFGHVEGGLFQHQRLAPSLT